MSLGENFWWRFRPNEEYIPEFIDQGLSDDLTLGEENIWPDDEYYAAREQLWAIREGLA